MTGNLDKSYANYFTKQFSLIRQKLWLTDIVSEAKKEGGGGFPSPSSCRECLDKEGRCKGQRGTLRYNLLK